MGIGIRSVSKVKFFPIPSKYQIKYRQIDITDKYLAIMNNLNYQSKEVQKMMTINAMFNDHRIIDDRIYQFEPLNSEIINNWIEELREKPDSKYITTDQDNKLYFEETENSNHEYTDCSYSFHNECMDFYHSIKPLRNQFKNDYDCCYNSHTHQQFLNEMLEDFKEIYPLIKDNEENKYKIEHLENMIKMLEEALDEGIFIIS